MMNRKNIVTSPGNAVEGSSLVVTTRIQTGTVSASEIMQYLEHDRWMPKSQAAAYSSIRARKLSQEIRGGRLRGYKVGGKVLIRKSDLDEYIEAHKIVIENKGTAKTDLNQFVDKIIQRAKQNVQQRGGQE